jgi:hypothetical protein
VYEFYSSSPITGFLLAGYIGTTLYIDKRMLAKIESWEQKKNIILNKTKMKEKKR